MHRNTVPKGRTLHVEVGTTVSAVTDHAAGVAPSPLSWNLLCDVWDWSPVSTG
jgi:hypothetical protein